MKGSSWIGYIVAFLMGVAIFFAVNKWVLKKETPESDVSIEEVDRAYENAKNAEKEERAASNRIEQMYNLTKKRNDKVVKDYRRINDYDDIIERAKSANRGFRDWLAKNDSTKLRVINKSPLGAE